MWRSCYWRLGAWLCCPRSRLRIPADSGLRGLVSCIDRKAHPGEQVFGSRAGAVVSSPLELSISRRRSAPPSPPGPHPLLPPFPFTPSFIRPGGHFRPGSFPWPLSYPPGGALEPFTLSDLSPPVAPLVLVSYSPTSTPLPQPPKDMDVKQVPEARDPGLAVGAERCPFSGPPHPSRALISHPGATSILK